MMNMIKLYEEILSKLEEGVHVVDKNGITIMYNKAMDRIEGMNEEEVIGKRLVDILPDGGYGSIHLEVLRSGKPIEFEYQEYFSKQGKKIVTTNSTYPIFENGEIVGSVEISKDMTRMRAMYERMLELYSGVGDAKKGSFSFTDIIGESKAIKDVIEQSIQISKTSSNVLLVGDSGTGKEMFAQSIHNASLRRNKPFVAENCAAIPENLLESILFGTTKGSFTGAENKEGLLKQADGGTLMLDEINSMPINLQSKLLRVLETRKFRPIGSNKENNVDIRIIAATNKDPMMLVKEGKLREDLFYRLSVINIRIPNLRERKGDVKILTEYFIKFYENVFHKKIEGISEEVFRFFITYKWPGNIRELKHVIEGAVSMMQEGDKLQLKHMPYYIKNMLNIRREDYQTSYIQENINEIRAGKKSLEDVIEDIESNIIQNILEESNFNIAKTAETLGIRRQGLQYKLKKYRKEP